MVDFLSGAVMMASALCGLHFFKFWRRSEDRLFLCFALAFWALALERWVLVFVHPSHEFRPYVYGFRLLAFLIIIVAIVNKNRRRL